MNNNSNYRLVHGSLFSGIGGFDLAAETMGWANAFHCEWNAFARQVLGYYWPNATSYGNITETDFTIWRGRIDVLSGGFPCQPYSITGRRKGKEDDRHLWPEMLRAIGEVAPRYVVGENVHGLVNWNKGLVFNEVQSDLEGEGYEVQPIVLPACAVGAPHRRDRVFIVAYANKCTAGTPREGARAVGQGGKNNDEQEERGEQAKQHFGRGNVLRPAPDPCSGGLQKSGVAGIRAEKGVTFIEGSGPAWPVTGANEQQYDWDRFPTQSPVCSGNDGISNKLDGITFPKWRQESIKAYGNAVVPQVVLQIFKVIQAMEDQGRKKTVK